MSATPGEERQRLEREIKRLRHELTEAVGALPHLRQMVQESGDLLILADQGGRILEANRRLAALLAEPQAALYGQPLQRWLAHPGQGEVLQRWLAAEAESPSLRMELDLQPAAGPAVPMELEAHRLVGAVGLPARATLALREISERRRLQASEAARQGQQALIDSLRSSEARYRDLVAHLADGLAQLDAGGRLLLANPALHALLAVPEGELLGRPLAGFLPSPARLAWDQYWGAVLAGASRRFELPLQAADGTTRRAAFDLQPLPPQPDRSCCGAVATLMLRDVTQLHAALTELTTLAFCDPITGLGNAEAARRTLAQRLQRPSPRGLLVLWIDLDGFRRVNHSFGREAGDALLCQVADALRAWQTSADDLARVGGDEFLLLRPLGPDADEEQALQAAADAAVQQLREHVLRCVGGGLQGVPLGFCAGYSLAPVDGSDAEELLQAAATALSRARELGPGTSQRYARHFTAELRQELSIESRLGRAAAEGALRLVFQPQRDGQGCLMGAEALLRWNDPLLGAVSPASFIPLAERCGLIHALGHWALEQTCRQLRAWLDAGLRPPRIAVNLSPRQFELTVPSLVEQVQALLAQHHLPADLLELEITESCLLPASSAIAQMQELAASGVHLALDDFGTGFSCLSTLHRLAIHKLKIDRSFVDDLPSSASARTLVRTALAMGRGLELQTLAEGVETEAQLQVLQQMGCDAYQGFWFSRPLEAEAFADLLPRSDPLQPEDGSRAAGSASNAP
jgi:diguanylate cyclase (GGDEF)-like protein/PAS domain S-box-containing protein